MNSTTFQEMLRELIQDINENVIMPSLRDSKSDLSGKRDLDAEYEKIRLDPVDTARRVEAAWKEMLSGFTMKAPEIKLFDIHHTEMIIDKDISYYSVCEHHLLPFFGKVHVAYIASNKIIGLSKIARIVEYFSKRTQVQERLTDQIADFIMDIPNLRPDGVMVIVTGKHLCQCMRGVKNDTAEMVTSAVRGYFLERPHTKQEFLDLIKIKG